MKFFSWRPFFRAPAIRALRSPYSALRSSIERTVIIAGPFMGLAGLLGFAGQPLFYLIWQYGFPQPYESLSWRLAGGAICVPLIFRQFWPERIKHFLGIYWVGTIFFNLPLLFSFFLLQNQLSSVWVYSTIGGVLFLTFLVDLLTAVVLFIAGTAIAYWLHIAMTPNPVLTPDYLKHLIIIVFPLVFGGIINFQLQRYRRTQQDFEKRLRSITSQNAKLVHEQNQLLSRFLSNTIISRLRRYQTRYGLHEALAQITRQERRFCGIMQADVRNFTKMFGEESEIEVARLIHQCFAEISEIGQDLAVIKPVGDSIFMYIDDDGGRENAVHNILSLAVFFVHSVERINKVLLENQGTPLNFGIGIHAGEVVYGNLASDTLIDPTIIGINVNKTARLEELTKIPDIQSLVGGNAIILSEHLAFYGGKFIREEDLIPIDLKALKIHLRDFPDEKRVYGLPGHKVLTYFEKAEKHILVQREKLSFLLDKAEPNRYHGIPYFYEVQGMGPNTSWQAMIDVSAISQKTVNLYASQSLWDLNYEINLTDGQWLIISTSSVPGSFDEVDLESRIFEIIDGLEAASSKHIS